MRTKQLDKIQSGINKTMSMLPETPKQYHKLFKCPLPNERILLNMDKKDESNRYYKRKTKGELVYDFNNYELKDPLTKKFEKLN